MDHIRNLSIFTSVEDQVLEEVKGFLDHVAFERGELICRQGEPGRKIFFIRSGQVRVSVKLLEDQEETLGFLGPGDHVGEMSVITGGPVSANVTATTRTELEALDGKTFHHLCEKYPILYREISKTLSKRLLQSNQKRLATRLGKVTRFGTASGIFEGDLIYPTLVSITKTFTQETGSKPLLAIPLDGCGVDDFERLKKLGLLPDGQKVETGMVEGSSQEQRSHLSQVSRILRNDSFQWYRVENEYDLLLWNRERKDPSIQSFDRMDDLIFPLRPLYSQILVAQLDWPLTRVLEHRLPDDNIAFFIDLISEDCQTEAKPEEFTKFIPEGHRIRPEPDTRYWTIREPSFQRLRLLTDTLNDQAEGEELFHLILLHPADKPVLDYSRIRHLSKHVSLHTLPAQSSQPEETAGWYDGAPSISIQRGRNSRIARGKIVRDLAERQVGLALGGGGARGIAHIGVIKALAEEGIPIDLVAGSSMGAVVAGAFAEGRTPHRLVEDMRFHFGKLGNFLLDILDYNFPRTNLLRGRKIRRMIEAAMKDSTIEDCQIPLYLVCTDLITGKEIVLDHGPLGEAMRASGSLPGIFRPVWWEGHLLVDGAVLNKVPARVLQQKGANVILAVNVTPERDTVLLKNHGNDVTGVWRWIRRVPGFREWGTDPNILRIITRSLSVSGLHQSRAHSDAIDVEIKPRIEHFDFLSFDRFDEIVEAGAEAVREAMPQILHALGRKPTV